MNRTGDRYTSHETTQQAKRLLGALVPGVRQTHVTHGQVGLGDFVRAAVSQLEPASVVLSSWHVSATDVQSLGALLRCDALTDLLLVCGRGLETRHRRYADLIEDELGLHRVRVSRLHARFAVVRGSCTVVIRGSGGLSSSKGVDVWDVDCDEDLATFLEGVVNELVGDLPEGWASTREVDGALRRARGRSSVGLDLDLDLDLELDLDL